ncbi:chromatin remodelling complex Rsc7/Swp82 subunit-domain-containing protein [Melampsora americana]|nr:chromatin remodelling complex Rsc7/Swp82 subunit-domain-containing protein [Melampsora americana]
MQTNQSTTLPTIKPLTSRQRKEQEKIARQIERQRKKEEKERDKAERAAKRERERIERIQRKQQESRAFQKAKEARLLKATKTSVGKPVKASGSHSSTIPFRKIKVDARIETVRRLITSTPTGELYVQTATDPQTVASDPNARWCETKTYKGVTYLVEDDELTLPDDPKGDLKVTPEGVLLGDRQYKIPTFTSKARSNPNKHFVLSIDAARAAGYRDSLYFFRRNPLIQKLPCTQDEKDALIAAGFLSGNLKSRAVTMCSARNAFKVMGARFLRDIDHILDFNQSDDSDTDGKLVVDDYYEDAALASGAMVGEPAIADGLEPQDRSAAATTDAPGQETTSTSNAIPPVPQEPLKLKASQSAFRLALNNPNPTSAGAGGSLVKSNFGGDGRPPFGFVITDPKDRKRRPAPNLTSKNWMLQYCRAISEMNRHLRTLRNERLRPFPTLGSRELDSKLTPGAGVEHDPEDMEWCDVEVDMRLNTEGRILESGEESDGKTDEEEEEKSEGEASTPLPPPSDKAPPLSRITNALPPDSIITVFGLENASRTVDLNSERHNILLGASNGPNSSRAHSPAFGGHNRARARSPHKRMTKAQMKKPKNQWWTTTVRVRELKPKQPVMGLLDVHTGLPHLRRDMQSTRALVEKSDDQPDLNLDRKKRKRESEFNEMDEERLAESETGMKGVVYEEEEKKRTCKLPLVTVETMITDELCSTRPPLIPGMWDFRTSELLKSLS